MSIVTSIATLIALLLSAVRTVHASDLPRDIIAFWPYKHYNMQPFAISTARVRVDDHTLLQYSGEDFGSVWTKLSGGNVHVVLSTDISRQLREKMRGANLKDIACRVQPTEHPVLDYLYAYKTLLEGMIKAKTRYQPLPIGVSAARAEIAMHGRDPVYLLIDAVTDELQEEPKIAVFDAVSWGALEEYKGLKPLDALRKRWAASGTKHALDVAFDARVDATIIRAEHTAVENFIRDFGSP